MGKREWEMAFKLSASMSGSYSATFSKAQGQIAAFQKEIDALNKAQSDISAYQRQQQAIEASRSKMDMLQQQYDNLQAEMRETGDSSADMQNKLLAKQQQIDRTAQSLAGQTQKLGAMETALRSAGINTDNLTQESKRLAAEISDLRDKEMQAADSADTFGAKATAAFDAVGSALVASGIARGIGEIFDAYEKCVKVSADFEAGMSQVAATMGVAKEDVRDLSAFAKEMGATTSFSAVQSAEGLNILAMAGLSATDQISALPTVLDLAAAGNMDMATSATYVTGAVKGFSDQMDNARYYADLMAKGATMANTNVTMLGAALSGSAATASSYGQAADSVTLSLLRLAEQNVVGEEASNALNRAMADLYTPTEKTAGVLEKLHVSMYDANGDARDFNDVVSDLNAALSGFSVEQQNAYKNMIFTTRGLQAFNKMTVSSAETVERFWNGLRDSGGSAAKQAQTQLDNLTGAVTIYKSALEGLEITIGDQFNEELTGLTKIATEGLTIANEFAQKYPAASKAVTTFTGVILAAAGALASYAAAAKVVRSLELAATFGGALPVIKGVALGVAALAAGITALNEVFPPAIHGVDELTAGYRDAMAAHDEAISSMEQEYAQTDALIASLEAYRGKTSLTAEEQQELLATIENLNQALPGLGLTFDEVTGSISMSAVQIGEFAKAALAQEEYQQNFATLTTLTREQAKAQANAKEKADALSAAQEHLNEIQAVYDEETRKLKDATGEWLGTVTPADIDALTYSTEDLADAQYELDRAQSASSFADETLRSYDEQIAILTGEMGIYAQETEEAAVQTNALEAAVFRLGMSEAERQAAIEDSIAALQTLQEAYSAAYEAAADSIGGQMTLWDQATAIAEISTSTITGNLASQSQYWADYNANLESLRGRIDDVEGLRDVISSFADGSENSVATIAGMASATDEDLSAMVKNWQELQKQQEAAAEYLADIMTDYEKSMDEIAVCISENVAAFNLSDEAYQAGAATIRAYLASLTDALPEVQLAAQQIANSAFMGLQTSRRHGTNGIAAYAEGTNNAERGFALVGEQGPELVYFGGGEKVLTAGQTAALTAESGMSVGFAPVHVAFDIHVDGNATPETVDALREYSDDFAQIVLDIMDEREKNRTRLSYS